jgi:galactokinase
MSYAGAGWGGCTVSLVAETEVESFITKIKNAYGPYAGLEGEKLHEVIFATKPSSGACGEYYDESWVERALFANS